MPPRTQPSNPTRRRLVQLAAATSLVGVGQAAAQQGASPDPGPSRPLVPPWMQEQGRPVTSPPYGEPSRFENDVVRRPTDGTVTDTASWSFTPLQDLHGIITPNGLVFERHHAGVPDISPDAHRLMIHGLVRRPLVLTMDELVRFPAVSRLHFLECSGNSLTEYTKPATTVQTTHGLLSCVEWTGVKLSTLLDEVGWTRDARWVLAEGADGSAMTRSVPIEKALDDALVAYAQNGEALRPEQGYPVRLLLPGWEGNMSIKWLRRLELGREPWMTREETSKYTDLMPDGTARQFTFVMEAKSVITRPSGEQRLAKRGFCEITGLAWSGHGRVRQVDVTTDGGRTWAPASLDAPVLPKCLTRFRFPWTWTGEPAEIASRAIDETGYVQPSRAQLIDARGRNYIYHFNGIQVWHVDASGEVRNANA